MYPVTAGDKLFTFIVLMIGLRIVAIPTGLFPSALTTVRDEEQQKELTDSADLKELHYGYKKYCNYRPC